PSASGSGISISPSCSVGVPTPSPSAVTMISTGCGTRLAVSSSGSVIAPPCARLARLTGLAGLRAIARRLVRTYPQLGRERRCPLQVRKDHRRVHFVDGAPKVPIKLAQAALDAAEDVVRGKL